jgi:hypothetical protein
MRNIELIAKSSFLLVLTMMAAACIVEPRDGYYNGEPREGYYDRDHARWYHEHRWHDCGDRDEHCH